MILFNEEDYLISILTKYLNTTELGLNSYARMSHLHVKHN